MLRIGSTSLACCLIAAPLAGTELSVTILNEV